MIVNYKNAYEELKRLYELLEKENARLKEERKQIKEYVENWNKKENVSWSK